jgi:hypothetical protein
LDASGNFLSRSAGSAQLDGRRIERGQKIVFVSHWKLEKRHRARES